MKKIVGVLIVILLVFFISKGWWDSNLSPVSKDTETQKFIVQKGESFSDISDSLQAKGLIRSSTAFKIYAKQSGVDQKVQDGTFEISPSMSAKEIADVLVNKPVENWVTLLEGWRVEEMVEKLQTIGIDKKEFLSSAKEGYMFPDTYLFPREITVSQVVSTLRDNFENKYTDEIKAQIGKKGLTEDEGVILASIVEREARSDEVRKNVASILLKRLKIGMGLNVDAAIQYALGYQPAEKSWWKRNLTKDDLRVDSPYNTYIHSGLTPTPICNPSLSSLKAVANADATTPYLYYFHDSEGNTYYGKTLEEHNENVARHR